MRVAYVCADPGVPVFGAKGCSIHVQELLRALCRSGAEPTLLAARVGGMPPEDLRGVSLRRFGPAREGSTPARERALLAANRGVAARLERMGPFDLVYERHALFAYAGMEQARKMDVPGILEVNAPLLEEQRKHRKLVHGDKAREATRRSFAAASEIWAVSQEVASWLEGFAEARGRIRVVPNRVNLERFHPGAPPSRPSDHFTVGFVGSLKPWHGLRVLVRAFARLLRAAPPARLLLVGDGPERAALEAQARQLGVAPHVELTGVVDPKQVPGLLASMDLAVAPYDDEAGFYFSPLKVEEYRASGRALAASRTGEIARSVRHRVDGWLCEPGSEEDLYAAIASLRDDPALRASLGAAARARAEAAGDWSRVAADVIEAGRRAAPRALAAAL